MKTLLVKAHSFIDVITNSSSELFVTKNPSSIELLSGVDSRYIDKGFKKWNVWKKTHRRVKKKNERS